MNLVKEEAVDLATGIRAREDNSILQEGLKRVDDFVKMF